ncbi:MAG: AAA family ATPase [Saprospiraceae bacterium]|nr:AAA family ATPase [Saprospiraceae bacterium]
MKIKRLYINNYKSLVDFELLEPNPFSVFVGPNAAGKSNVFEALEFLSFDSNSRGIWVPDLFGTPSTFLNKKLLTKDTEGTTFTINFKIDYQHTIFDRYILCEKRHDSWRTTVGTDSDIKVKAQNELRTKEDLQSFYRENQIEPFFNSNRLFVGNQKLNKLNVNGDERLRLDADNLEPVLHRILQDEAKREEITEWMESLIPGLEKVEVAKSDLSGDYFLRIFEKNLPDPIGKHLISDGTYNILALLTAVYQSDEPQFLCIEEPENGLNPYVVRTLVDFFRNICEEKGHYIWLNTHSATLVRELRNEEIILVDKIDGITRAKQIPHDFKRYDLTMDEAWLTNALGGGLPW